MTNQVVRSLFSCDTVSAVLMGRHPASVQHRLVTYGDHAMILHLDYAGVRSLTLANLVSPLQILSERHGGSAVCCISMFHDISQRAAGPDLLRLEPVYLGVTLIADYKALLTVEQADPLGHVLQHRLELGRLDMVCRQRLCIHLSHDSQQGIMVKGAVRPRGLSKLAC